MKDETVKPLTSIIIDQSCQYTVSEVLEATAHRSVALTVIMSQGVNKC